jgi:hypothetical protein
MCTNTSIFVNVYNQSRKSAVLPRKIDARIFHDEADTELPYLEQRISSKRFVHFELLERLSSSYLSLT